MTEQLQDWQQRLVTEHSELKIKCDNLLKALQDPVFKTRVPEKVFKLMEEQWDAMMHYYTLLGTRMDLLKVPH